MNKIDAYDDSTMVILMYVLVFRSMFMVIYLKLLLVILLFGLDFRSENWRLDEGRLPGGSPPMRVPQRWAL